MWARGRSRGITAVKICDELNGRPGSAFIAVRTVSGIIKRAEADATERGALFRGTDWKPWQNPADHYDDEQWSPSMTAEDAQFLLRISIAVQTVSQRPLRHHEALWAMRLRPSLQGIDDTFSAWFVVEEYGRREEVRMNLGQDRADTSDLDSMLAFRPWEKEGRDAYSVALRTSALPIPLISSMKSKDGEYQFSASLLAYRTGENLGLEYHQWESDETKGVIQTFRLLPQQSDVSAVVMPEMSWGELLSEYLKVRHTQLEGGEND